jgi:hypothetical protein
MPRAIVRYAVTFGLAGCYMPDSHDGAFEVYRRKDLADLIRSELETYDLPKSAFNQVRLTNLWRFIKRNGSSSAHFSIHHEGHALEFHGLTEAEYAQQQKEP